MILGVILFFTLLGIIIYKVVRNQPIWQLGILFIIPVIMIGYSTIKRIQFKDIVIEIENDAKALKNDPTDQQTLARFKMNVDKIEGRPRPKKIDMTIAGTFIVTRNEKEAIEYVDRVLKKDPHNVKVRVLDDKLRERGFR
jgi:hypothetical protein